jgi:sulfur-oxidizing protein SoxX
MAQAGNPALGEQIVTSRQTGLCTLCHSGPFPHPELHGNIGPSLSGIGARLSVDEIRVRVVNSRAINPASKMPIYGPVAGLQNVASGFIGKPILTDQQIEDVVAYLATLRTP